METRIEPTVPRSSALFPWPNEDTGPWLLKFEFAEVNGRDECVGMHVRWSPKRPGASQGSHPPEDWRPPTEPLTASLLRKIPFGSLVDQARSTPDDIQALNQRLGEWGARALEQQAELVRARKGGKGRKGRPPLYDDAHFREVARIYAVAWQSGGNPTKAVADAGKVTKSTAAKWVARCRRLGFLPPTTRGRAGGASPTAQRHR